MDGLAASTFTSYNLEELQKEELQPSDSDSDTNVFLDKLNVAFTDLLTNKENPLDMNTNEYIQTLYDKYKGVRLSINKGGTSRLWLMYLDMVDILCNFIKGERTGDFQLHLTSCVCMLPFLAAAGHFNYVKSVMLYLQKMEDLKTTNSNLYQRFNEGYHVIRRTDRDWAGLSVDLVIEQELMKNLKSAGGITRRALRGALMDAQRQQWILSMPTCAAMNRAMQVLTGVSHYTSEQHQEMGATRQKRDTDDTLLIAGYLQSKNPFCAHDDLQNIATGEVADQKVNVEKAFNIGQLILNKMVGQSVYNYSFSRKDLAITMAHKCAVSVGDDTLTIDPNLLFQCFAALTNQQDDVSKLEVFSYELCAYPAALFESPVLPRLPNKASLSDYLWTLLDKDVHVQAFQFHDNTEFVMDGGALLHKIPWQKSVTYHELCQIYYSYIAKNYGTKVTVVFDGYQSGPGTKDATHLRHGAKHCQNILFESEMKFIGTKDVFSG